MNNEFIELIHKIRLRPAMYLAERTIACLRAFLDGWRIARNGREDESRVIRSFEAWIVQRFGLKPGPQSWDMIIRFYSNDGYAALDRFFSLFEEWEKETQDSEPSSGQ